MSKGIITEGEAAFILKEHLENSYAALHIGKSLSELDKLQLMVATDNAIIEALNGWIKVELFLDFGLATAKDVPKLLDEYMYYFNSQRPAAALGIKAQFSIRPN